MLGPIDEMVQSYIKVIRARGGGGGGGLLAISGGNCTCNKCTHSGKFG